MLPTFVVSVLPRVGRRVLVVFRPGRQVLLAHHVTQRLSVHRQFPVVAVLLFEVAGVFLHLYTNLVRWSFSIPKEKRILRPVVETPLLSPHIL